MKGFFSLLLVFGAATLAAQGSAGSQFVSAIDDELLVRAFATLANDSMQGRRMASPGSIKARAYITAELTRIGVEPLVPGFVATFPGRILESTPTGVSFPFGTINFGTIPSGVGYAWRGVTGSNILGVVRGTEHPDRYIVVSAHYDHIGLFDGQLHPGANDNASGTAALLAIADLLTAAKPKNSIILAFMDGEEYGMLGASAFTRSPPVPIKSILANVNIDMISRSADDILYFVGEKYQPRLSALATTVGGSGIVRIQQGLDGRDSKEDLFRRSDQWAFHQRSIPAVLFTAEELLDYHRPSDIAAKLNIGFYVRAMSAISDFIRRMDESIESFVPVKR
jgi:Zn-dependent M28 family amino/carboxypeptidase